MDTGQQMSQEQQLKIAEHELRACIEKRGAYSDDSDRMGLTIGELDWTCEVIRLSRNTCTEASAEEIALDEEARKAGM